ncbi:MAG: Ig-like domain-containing protein [bacterium]
MSGVTTLSANASDNLGVTKVEFYNGNTLLGSDTGAPYSITWDTKSVANNMYGISAKAYDAAGNISNTSVFSVTVNNGNAIIDTIAPVVSTILYTQKASTIILT